MWMKSSKEDPRPLGPLLWWPFRIFILPDLTLIAKKRCVQNKWSKVRVLPWWIRVTCSDFKPVLADTAGKCRTPDPGCAGGTVVVHVSLTTMTRVRFRLRAVTWLKLPWSHVRRVLSSLILPSIAGFLQVLRFFPVVTLDPWEVALTGPLDRTA